MVCMDYVLHVRPVDRHDVVESAIVSRGLIKSHCGRMFLVMSLYAYDVAVRTSERTMQSLGSEPSHKRLLTGRFSQVSHLRKIAQTSLQFRSLSSM